MCAGGVGVSSFVPSALESLGLARGFEIGSFGMSSKLPLSEAPEIPAFVKEFSDGEAESIPSG